MKGKSVFKILVLIGCFVVALFFLPVKEGQTPWALVKDNLIFEKPVYKLSAVPNIDEIKIEVNQGLIENLVELHKSISYKRADGLKAYNNGNVWLDCNVIFKGEKLQAKMKSHSNEPYKQRKGDRISLKVKLVDAKIKGVSTFKLILFERIKETASQIALLSNYLNLANINSELINVKINEGKAMPYFFEVTTSVALATNHPSFFNLKKGSRKSLIKVFENDTFPYYAHLGKLNEEISSSYVSINKCLETGDSLGRFLDYEYMARLYVFGCVGGFTSHGFTPGNLIMPLDTNKGKFYPITHRDFFRSALNKEKKEEIFKLYKRNVFGVKTENPLLLFTKLLEDKSFKFLVEKELNHFLESSQLFLNQLDSVNLFYDKIQTAPKSKMAKYAEALGIENPYSNSSLFQVKNYMKFNIEFLKNQSK